jgi:hypothetical protein
MMIEAESTTRHGRACPGHPRLILLNAQDVDARHKAGHDELMIPSEPNLL